MSSKKILYKMPKKMYDTLLRGQKGSDESSPIKGCGSHEELVAYVDATFGLLGDVIEVVAE